MLFLLLHHVQGGAEIHVNLMRVLTMEATSNGTFLNLGASDVIEVSETVTDIQTQIRRTMNPGLVTK